MTRKILIVEDDPAQRRMISLLIHRKIGLGVVEADGGRMALSLLRDDVVRENICLVIIDLNMPNMGGIELLKLIRQQYPNLPIIILTGSKDLDVAVQVMKLGANDFLNKPINPQRFQVSVCNAMKIGALEKEVKRLKHKDENRFLFDDLIGYDRGLLSVVSVGRKAALAEIPVMLTGKTGVGKEVFARAIHGESARSGGAFVAINCGAIPKDLVESTLFGHEKGAFTGAITKSLGRFREAEGGTIFLDEVGELPLDAQVKLLRVLQEREIYPVGADKAIPINVRIISATNRDLEAGIEEGVFRDDLYFRLNVLPIHLPALKQRPEDIPALIHHFLERFSVSEGLPLKELTEVAESMLSTWDWVGNVRELENTIHRAIVLCDGDILDIGDFTSLRQAEMPLAIGCVGVVNTASSSMFEINGILKTMARIEQEAMKFSLKYYDNNVTQAARALGMAKSTFYRKLKE
ncbi:MAG: sigma-54-dependent Fis family transcriptional regulator [Zetaproteobacteria bacterium]|nr:MAG: sigma-54-dependent Fis family transcriptional regulator [Zetaproteobacteria bacterium]